jgi:hypothetical protein
MIAPADTITSRIACTTARAPLPSAAPYSTPVARAAPVPASPAHTILVAWWPGSTVNPGCAALVFAPAGKRGYRYALAEDERTEWLPTGCTDVAICATYARVRPGERVPPVRRDGTYNVGVTACNVTTRKAEDGLRRCDDGSSNRRAVVRADKAHTDRSVVPVCSGLEIGAFGVQRGRRRVKALGLLHGSGEKVNPGP